MTVLHIKSYCSVPPALAEISVSLSFIYSTSVGFELLNNRIGDVYSCFLCVCYSDFNVNRHVSCESCATSRVTGGFDPTNNQVCAVLHKL